MDSYGILPLSWHFSGKSIKILPYIICVTLLTSMGANYREEGIRKWYTMVHWKKLYKLVPPGSVQGVTQWKYQHNYPLDVTFHKLCMNKLESVFVHVQRNQEWENDSVSKTIKIQTELYVSTSVGSDCISWIAIFHSLPCWCLVEIT